MRGCVHRELEEDSLSSELPAKTCVILQQVPGLLITAAAIAAVQKCSLAAKHLRTKKACSAVD